MGDRRSFYRQQGTREFLKPDQGAGTAQGHAGTGDCVQDEQTGESVSLEYVELAGPLAWTAPPAAVSEALSGSFEAVVERYQAPLISFLYGMVGVREQAEDLAQDTLIKAYTALEKRRPGQEFSAGWLFRIARNTALDALRRKRRIHWLPFGIEHEAALPVRGDFAGRLAERELVQQVLARLPERYRTCLLLRTVAGRSNGEVAEALGISARNVNMILFRARERFRREYALLEGGPPGQEDDGRADTHERGRR